MVAALSAHHVSTMSAATVDASTDTERAQRLYPGRIIKTWTIVRRCGEGGCGVVYEVKSTNKSDTRRYALKVEPTQTRKDDEILKMEVHVLRALQVEHHHHHIQGGVQGKSEHVIKLVGCGKEKAFNYFVMPLLGMNMGDMRRLTPNQHFSMSTAVRLARQALKAIADVHNAGFVHRDVKYVLVLYYRGPEVTTDRPTS